MRIQTGREDTRTSAAAWAVVAALVGFASAAFAAEVAEVEPNSDIATATPLAAGDVGAGAIVPAGDDDFWVRSGTTAGQQVFALVQPQPGTDVDRALLILRDDTGALVDQDTDDGPGFSPALAGVPIPTSGDVFFDVSELNNDGTLPHYRLFQLIADPGASVAESEPNDTTAQANVATANSLVTGTLAPGETDFFSIDLTEGDELAVILDREPNDDTHVLASRIDVYAPDGTTLVASADPVSGDGHAVGPIGARESGSYFVRVTRDAGGTGDGYRMALVTSVPEPGALGATFAALAALRGVIRHRGRTRSRA